MGCLSSKEANETNANPSVRVTSSTNNPPQEQQRDVPPIVITKAHSVASVDSSVNPSTSVTPEHPVVVDEKPPVIIEERTQEHHYGTPPTDTKELEEQENKVDIKEVKPIVIMAPQTQEENPTVVPATEIPEAKKAAEEAGILPTTPSTTASDATHFSIIVRLSSNGKDITVPIPSTEPYMTIAELRSKIGQENAKFIHLGRILTDEFVLVPAKSPSTNNNVVNISNHGVIQAMIYQP